MSNLSFLTSVTGDRIHTAVLLKYWLWAAEVTGYIQVLPFITGSSKSRLVTKGNSAFLYLQGVSQGGLWHERTSEALSGKLRGRQLHYFSALLEAGALDSLWQIHRKWAFSLCTSAEGDESDYKLKCSFFNISGMLGLGKTTQSKGMLSLEDITCHLETIHCTFGLVLQSQTALNMKN